MTDRDALALEMHFTHPATSDIAFDEAGTIDKRAAYARADIALAHIEKAHAEYGELIDAVFEHCNQKEPVEGLHWVGAGILTSTAITEVGQELGPILEGRLNHLARSDDDDPVVEEVWL
jgi:hypothetical protein